MDELERKVESLQKELQAERMFTRQYLDLSDNIFVMLTSDERIHLGNRATWELLGYKEEELQGANWFDRCLPPPNREAQRKRFRELMENPRELFRQSSEFQVKTKSGEIRDIKWGISILFGPGGKPIGQLMIGRDITGEKRAQATIQYMALHDDLTKLANRAALKEYMPKILANAQSQGWSVALFFMDFDNFKTCNDTYGHDAGDELLRQIADRLRGMIRPNDYVARLGGDEFVLLIPDLSPNIAEARVMATRVANRIRETFQTPFTLFDNIEHSSTASVGISFYPTDTELADVLLTQGDSAMYEAKQSGKSRYTFYSDIES